MSNLSRGGLRRSLGLFDVVALGINSVIGSGIFLLPGPAYERMGAAALAATLGAGLLAILVGLCFAEVGSRFEGTGGPYLYAHAAFGKFVGFEVGWITCWTGLVAWAALLNAFTTALSHFLPEVASGLPRHGVITLLLVGFAVLNFLGAKQGARLSNLTTVAKLAAIGAFVLLGLVFVGRGGEGAWGDLTGGGFGGTVLLMLYAFVGFENAAVPAGEMKQPRSDVPRALLLVLGGVTVLYLAVQALTYAILERPGEATNAVAEAASQLFGAGGVAIAAAIVISILGVNAASAVIAPRRFFAMAERREMPAWLARVHPGRGTPWLAILATYSLTGLLALTGTFRELAVVTVVGRLLQYIPTCLALVALRRRGDAPPAAFRAPAGVAVAVAAILLCLLLLFAAETRQIVAGAVAVASGLPAYLWLRRRSAAGQAP